MFDKVFLFLQASSTGRNNNKVVSIETRHIVIADLLPRSDLEKYMYITLF